MKKELRIMALDDIRPYENNPRYNDQAVEAVAESIRQCEYIAPIVVDEDFVILAGHTRAKALERLGRIEAEVMIVTGLTDAQKRKYRLLDNKTNEFADWDFDKLTIELDGLDFGGFDFGFDIETEELPEIIEDEAPEPPKEPKAKPGDIYRLGDHVLMCGDATNIDDVQKLIGDAHIQLALTDPPYGISVVRGGQSEQATGRVGGVDLSTSGKVGGGSMSTPINNRITPDTVVPAKTYDEIIGDDTTETAQQNYDIIQALTDNQIIFGGNYFTEFLPASRCWLVWDKENTGNFADAELAWTSFDKSVKLYRWLWNGLSRKGDRKSEGITRVHPTQKPVGLMAVIMADFSNEGDNILDCFGGSGSTLIAAEQTGRKCYMMEMSPAYIDVIIERWENFAGKKAVLLNED